MPLTWAEAAGHMVELPRVEESERDGVRVLTVAGHEFARDEGATMLVVCSPWEEREMLRAGDPAVSAGPMIDGMAHIRVNMAEASDDPEIIEMLTEGRRIAEHHVNARSGTETLEP
jgi:hypothetical protein